MNTKSSWVILALVLLAVIFVPLIPGSSIECVGDVSENCDDSVAYVSIYQKYLK